MVSEIAVIPDSSRVVVNRWRIVWGTVVLLIAAISGSAVGVLWSWASMHTQSQNFVLRDARLAAHFLRVYRQWPYCRREHGYFSPSVDPV